MLNLLIALGIIAFCIGAFVIIMLMSYFQVTYDMTDEERERFLKYIEENPGCFLPGFYED